MAIEKTINLAPTTEENTTYTTSGSVSTRAFKILRQKVDGASAALTVAEGEIDLRVTYNDVISAINLSPETITISASKITLSGDVVLKSNLTDGTTSISGSNINTGVINADLITTGTLSADRIYGGTINGNNVSVTNLSAGSITSGTINVSRINGGYLSTGTIGGWSIGSSSITSPSGTVIIGSGGGNNITLGGSGTGGGTINLANAQIYNYGTGVGMSGGIYLHGGITFNSNVAYDIGSSSVRVRYLYVGTTIYGGDINCEDITPTATNSRYNGTSSYRWNYIYGNNVHYTSLTNDSDRVLKKDITSIDKAVDLILNLKPVQFKYINGTSDRNHYGLIAQEVKEAMDAVGIDDAGIYVDQKIGVDPNSVSPEEYASLTKGVRYTELIAPMIQTIQHLDSRVKELENKAI